MSDPRYQPGIVQGIALSRTHGAFPEMIPGLGRKCGGQPCGLCAFCPGTHPQFSLTWVKYGGLHVCGRCARLLVSESGAEVSEALSRAMGRTA